MWLWGDFVRVSQQMSSHSLANPYNGSIEEVASSFWRPLVTGGWGPRLLWVARIGAAAGLWWCTVRDADDDAQWAYGWLVVLLVAPLVWWHYLWVAVAATGIVLAPRRVDPRALVMLPVLALVTVPLSIVNSRNSAWPVAQGLFLIGVAVALAVISVHARRADRLAHV